ncbi:hypothetical protein ACT7CT_24940 [Bacillus sanguinis]
MLEVGDIVKGSLWPEIVEIKKCEDIQGSFYRVEAYGKDSNQYYQVIMLPEQLQSIEKLNDLAGETLLSPKQLQRYMLYRELFD